MPPNRFTSVRLYVLVTSDFTTVPPLEAARLAIEGGADAIQLREKEMSDRDFLDLARQMRRLTAQHEVLFIVNDRVAIARLADADGVHLGQDDLPLLEARSLLPAGRLIGVSTHEMSQARRAASEGADYIGVGPVYPTSTKGYESGVGLSYLRSVANEITIPFVAIGGITLDRIGSVMEAATHAIAVCSAVIGAPDIAAAAREFKTKLRGAECGS